MIPLLEVRNLVKHYRDVHAVKGVSFTIEKGGCFGLLGPNGAGKTTTVEMLEGIQPPSGGDIYYKGERLGLSFRQEAGIMFQRTSLQEFITVRETLKMFSDLYRHTLSLQELVASCALAEFLDRDTRKLSGGQRQRMLLAIALVNDPQILFLDEPTTGLDPQARHNFWALIEEIRTRGKTVVLTTHYMDEAYTLCERIAIMDHGEIIANGTPRALLAEHFNEVILQLPRDELPASIETLPLTVKYINGAVEIATDNVNATINELIGRGIPLSHLQIRARDLEDLFLELTGRELRA